MAAPKFPRLNRRTWLQLISALSAAPALEAQTPAPAPAPQRPAPPPQRISKDQVVAALATMGLHFTDPQLDMLLPSVNRTLTQYEALREIDIPLDTPPAILFSAVSPRLSRRRMATPPSARRKPPRSSASKTRRNSPFSPPPNLARCIRARRITSTALTQMYLERLKTYGPKLNCVITLTEDLALEQAKDADADLRRGRHLSPLHGVPYGAKDLFDTKGILTTWGAEPYQNRVPDSDATVIEKLRAAGAVLVAKLSMGALAQGGLWFGGMTKTPWNYEQTSSGSSAGLRFRHRRRAGRLLHRHGNAGLHRFAQHALRRGRRPAHLRPRQPQRRHGAELDAWTRSAPSAVPWPIAPKSSASSRARTAKI